MSLLSSISSLFESRSAPSGPIGSTWVGGPAYIDASGSRRAPTPAGLIEAYKSLIYACVQINANAVARVPLKLYADASKGEQPRSACEPRGITRGIYSHLRSLPHCRSLGQLGDVREIGNHPVLDAIDEPDPEGYYDRRSLIDLICRYMDVVGTAYLLLDGPKTAPPYWLWPLASQYVTVTPASNSPLILNYRYYGSDVYMPEEILRFRGTISLKDPYKSAFSPSYASLQYANLEDTWVSMQESLLAMGPRPLMVATAKDATMPPGPNERKRFAQDLDQQHSRGNAGRVLVSDGAWELKPVSYSPSDLSGLSISQYDKEMTANVFGIPLPFLSSDTNLANLQAAREQHAANAVEPRCNTIAAVFTRLVRRYDPRLFFAFDPAVPEDEERKAKVAQIYTSTGVRPIDEIREEMNLPPVPWGKEPWLPGTLVQPSMAIEKHEQGLEMQKAGLEQKDKELDLAYGGGGSESDPAAGAAGDDSNAARSAVDEGRFDAILSTLERSLGL